MEDRFSVLEGADVTEYLFQNGAGFKGVLTHTGGSVGIGANGDDFAAKLLETAEVIFRGQESAAAVMLVKRRK